MADIDIDRVLALLREGGWTWVDDDGTERPCYLIRAADEIERLRARLAEVEAVRDWMGRNNEDAEYDLVIVALNNILEGVDRD